MIFDLLVGGMLSAALVPVFSDYARPERRREFGQVVGTVMSVLGLAVAGLVVLVLLLMMRVHSFSPGIESKPYFPALIFAPPIITSSSKFSVVALLAPVRHTFPKGTRSP